MAERRDTLRISVTARLADMGEPNTDRQVTTDFDVTPLINTGRL
jgi:hypothetical protein